MTARCDAEMCQYWTGHGCACEMFDIERSVPEEHRYHDIHGPVIEVHPDGSTSLDEDCDCPPNCAGCEHFADCIDCHRTRHGRPECGELSTEALRRTFAAVPDGEDAVQSRAQHLVRLYALRDGVPWDSMTPEDGYRTGQAFAARYILWGALDAPDDAGDGEDVPARFEAAAEALEAAGMSGYWPATVRDLARRLRDAESADVRAAVAAALARPTGGAS